ncbi:hypothetical protein [Kitasatospora sp. NPDC005856]|uniref:hypothetical protein n=1 Tax=Kitasatospora sp. NPDC005856 TaxID=3154566 RepID=UPI0033E41CD4
MSALVDVSVLRWLPTAGVDVAMVRGAVAGLVAAVPGSVLDVNVAADGRTVGLQVASVAALSVWFDLVGWASGAVSSRDGGGLAWHVRLPMLPGLPGVRVELTAVSGEFEVLPRTALVRAMCPWMPQRWALEDREAAAWARRAA